MNESEVSELATRARAGDRRSFEALVHRLIRPALAAAWEFVENREDAEDVVQEVFVRTWKQLGHYDPGQPFAPWFFTLLRNVARNSRRRSRRWPVASLEDETSIADTADTPESDRLERIDLDQRIQALMPELSPMQQACFRLIDIEGFSRVEVASMLGVSAPTVRVHVHRARKLLRARLGAEGGIAER